MISLEIFYFDKFKVNDIEFINNILKFLLSKPIFSRFYLQVYIWVDSGMMISGFTKNYNSNRTLPYGNNITRALSKIKIKVKISQEDLVYQYALSLTCYVISDPNINPRRKYKTVLSILMLVNVNICNLGRPVFYYTEAVTISQNS